MQPSDSKQRKSKNRPNESDAVEIWIARWLRHKRSAIVNKYDCDPRRIYEIWEGHRFPDSREKAQAAFLQRYPELIDRIDFSTHKRIPRSDKHADQLNLFTENAAC